MPGAVDFAYLIFFSVVISLFEHYVWFPRFRAELALGNPRARLHAYRRTLIGQWAIALGAIAIWVRARRSAADLGFAAPAGWRLIVGLVIVAVAIGFVLAQLRSVLRASPEELVAVRPKLERYEFLLPHTLVEFRWFSALSFTAGFCEELLYRGYFAWVLHFWLGWTGAVALGVALFGVAHSYQGRNGAIRATLAGVVMGALFLITRWLVPVIVLHALIDFGSGIVGFIVLRSVPRDPSLPAAADA
jgi:membrane protease YdiL (CAAX protease family)